MLECYHLTNFFGLFNDLMNCYICIVVLEAFLFYDLLNHDEVRALLYSLCVKLENSGNPWEPLGANDRQILSYWSCLYFMIVTSTTVGYI